MRHFVLLMAFVPALSWAQPLPGCEWTALETDTIASRRIRALIKEKNFAAVEDELTDKLKRYERGEYSDLVLYGDVTNALRSDPALEPLLAQWAAEKPRSFFARWLRAEYHSAVGYAKRGAEFSSKTSAEQMAAMEAEFVKAAHEFKAARDLRPTSALPQAGLIGIARAVVGSGAVMDLAVEAERADPRNLSARRQAVYALAPKWGGSFEAMDQLVDRAAKVPVGGAQLRYLQYSVEMAKANHHDVVTKEKTKAIGHWRRAVGLCSSPTAWGHITRTAYDIEDWKTVKEAATHSVQSKPGVGTVLQRRGWAHEKMGEMGPAIKDYEAAAELGESWAQNRLGYYLMLGQHMPQDIPRARRLLESAVAKGNATAKTHLEWLNKQPAPAR